MALKPTIFKFNIALADLNHHHYPNLNLTIGQHPSETTERMLVRLLVFCLHSHTDTNAQLAFTKGLSATDEPDIWHKSLDGQLTEWIDVGEPSYERMKKACRLAKNTFVYSFNSKSMVWWKQSESQFAGLPITVIRIEWLPMQQLAAEVQRTANWAITISEQSLFVTTDNLQIEVPWITLQ